MTTDTAAAVAVDDVNADESEPRASMPTIRPILSHARTLATVAGIVATVFGGGAAFAGLQARVEQATVDASAAHASAAAFERSGVIPSLEARVTRIEEHDVDLVVAVRALDDRQRRGEINSYIACKQLGGGKQCAEPASLASALPR